MKKIANRDCAAEVAACREFKGSNLEGKWVGGTYMVLSYGWYPIIVRRDFGPYYVNTDGYSPSTKRQIWHARPTGAIPVSYLMIKAIIGGAV